MTAVSLPCRMAPILIISRGMNKLLSIILLSVLSCGCKKGGQQPGPVVTKPDTTVTTTGPQAVVKTNSQKVYVHYMAWFETPATSGTGQWGQHWSMANENPNTILPN